MRGKLGHELICDTFAIEPLLQHVERLHAMLAHDQELAVNRARQPQRIEKIGKALGNVLAGARIEPRDRSAVMARGHGLHANAVPFPLGHEFGGVEPGKVRLVERMRQHHRPERRRIAAFRLFRAAFEPGEQLDIGRRQAGPKQLDILRVGGTERGDRRLGESRRNADAQSAGDELDQRPAAGFVQRIEPARQPRRQLGLAEGGKGFDDFSEARCTHFSPAGRG